MNVRMLKVVSTKVDVCVTTEMRNWVKVES